MFHYILWDQSGELFSWGQFTMRWSGLLLVIAFIVGRQVLVYIYKKEGKLVKDADLLIVYLVIAVTLGARLGHVIFYQPQLWSKPLTVFLPFSFKPSFHFIGMTGFSSHGAALGILFGVWLYCLRNKPRQSYLHVLDRISMLAVWIAIPFLIGSFLNSEVEGVPTNSAVGAVMIQPVTLGINKLPCCIMRNPGGENPLTQVIAKKNKDVAKREDGHHSIALYLFFKAGIPTEVVDEFMLGDVKTYLFDMSQLIYEPGTLPLHYAVFKEPTGDFEVRVRTIGVARYPVQLFEAVSYLILFMFLFWYWYKYKLTLPSGRIFGFSMIVFWGLRFGYEFLKENKVSFVKDLGLNKAQILSIPMVMIGIAVLVLSHRKTKALE